MPVVRKAKIRDVEFGENVTIVEPVNIYECKIGDDCFIGPFVEIQKGVKIGKNCKIQSHTFICEGVTIEDNVFISKDDLDLLDVGFTAIGNLASTISHNIQNNLNEDARYFQRGSWDYHFSPEKIDGVRKAIHKYLRKTDIKSRELITTLAETNRQKGQLTAGISMFYFEEEPQAQ